MPLGAIGRWIDPDAGVAAAIHQAIENGRADAGEIIGSDDWAGCARESRPGKPMVVRKRVTTEIFFATAIRS